MQTPTGATTAERIIVAAERLFSERGLNAVSLREVGAEAGQRNSGVVQYHFGDKEKLLAAILDYRMQSINDARTRMLAELDADGRSGDLCAILEAFILPLATDDATDTHYVRFLSQLLADPLRRTGFSSAAASSLRDVWGRIGQALAGLPDDVVADRLSMLVNMAIRTVADHEGEATRPGTPWLVHLVDASLGLLTAPVTPTATQS
ncbi:TetR/AcrR family transcriptional regulator [Gordonia neofelifaecis]|uniref:TetR family transcriptional regulator n=1 Tax=Gordonia neofelifaecis NRRL B-59395 TaxID=644548 RepID=F1YHY6_9ACTN|nr:TetR/AcrR family transcriptional regulator [Gordonia neofelifaecis]EGD55540.1 TetR family transcriptional regulator [Gordonia neofelifaecis NRRL B-59395]